MKSSIICTHLIFPLEGNDITACIMGVIMVVRIRRQSFHRLAKNRQVLGVPTDVIGMAGATDMPVQADDLVG
jgi:hypothetical protein